MDKLLSDKGVDIYPFNPGEIIEGTVIGIRKTALLLDLDGRGIGVVFGRELGTDYYSRKYKKGDRILAYVLDFEDEEGRIPLSLRRVGKGNITKELEEKYKNKETLQVVPQEANKGGLIIEIGGLKGFLPTSQLSSEHYPRVEDGNKGEILSRLLELVGNPLTVKIIDFNPKAGKLIFSEKEAKGGEKEKIASSFKVGQKIKGKVTGIVDFGAFVDIGGIEGLIHISEISWEKVEDISKFLKIGNEVEVKIIEIENGKISLSIKRLKEDPLFSKISKLKKGDLVEGKVVKIAPFGVFVKFADNLEGLIHVSELGEKLPVNPEKIVKVGEKISAKILTIDKKERKIFLTLKGFQKPTSSKKK